MTTYPAITAVEVEALTAEKPADGETKPVATVVSLDSFRKNK